jgi:hypothetical protein
MKKEMTLTQKNIWRELYKKRDQIKRMILESILKDFLRIESAAL